MASGKTLFGAVVGRFLFREVQTTEIRELGSTFRLVTFGGDALRDVTWEAGDKLQIYLPGRGMRTYTPMRWDPARASAELLVYIHGASPGAEWGRRLRAGDHWQFFGPRRSIRSSELDGPVILFGDETSFAVARALADAKRGSPVSCVFEVSDVAASTKALEQLELVGSTIERQSADGHLEAAYGRLLAALEEHPRASLVMTGRAQSIQLLRARLKAKKALRAGKVKAYWSVGKAGLD